MKRVFRGGLPGSRRALLGAVLAGVVATSGVLTACTSSGDKDTIATTGAQSGSGQAPAPTTPAPPQVTVAPKDGARKVRLDKTIKVTAAGGTLSGVKVTAKGKTVKGELSADGLTWRSTSSLAPGTKYKVSVDAAGGGGAVSTTTSDFRTLTPKATATASVQPGDGWVVGVGMPVIVNFSRSVGSKYRDDVEDALSVKTTKDVEGAWRWITSTQVQWRPKKYWPSKTKVKVTADIAGVELASGVWGQKKRTADFKIGDAMVSTVDVSGHTLTVRRNGKVIRTIPVTNGKASMPTRNGVKIIMTRETEHRMRSESIGIDKDDPDYYDIVAKYAMRLTYSGEFLHAADWSAGSHGRANVSHGCTGMSTSNAKWLFNQSKVGDVVVYKNSPRSLEPGNGYTAWNMSYSAWKKG